MEINYDELREIGFYSYVAKHYWEMTGYQLSCFVKELAWSIESNCGQNLYKKIQSDAIDELKEQEV
jgi:hypothetical protein